MREIALLYSLLHAQPTYVELVGMDVHLCPIGTCSDAVLSLDVLGTQARCPVG